MFKKIIGFVLAPLASLFGLISSAWAALPAGVSAAVTEAQGDGVELGGMMLAMAVAVGVIFWLKRKV
jgi:hypothetical protein